MLAPGGEVYGPRLGAYPCRSIVLGNRAPELRPDTPSQTRARAELAIFAHALLRVASSADGVIVGLYLAALNREYGRIHAGLVGTLGAAAYGAELMASVPLGLAADAFSVRGLMAAGALVSALGTQLFAVAVSTPVFFLSRLLQGVGIAGVTPPLLKFLAQSTAHEPVRRARVMSFFELSMLAGLALGGVLGTQFWAALNAGAFSAVALLIVVCAVLLFLGAPRGSDPATTGATLQGLREVLSSRFVRRLAPICGWGLR
jgi:MFS family permease